MSEPDKGPVPDSELNQGPYGLRGEHTPPLANMFGGYAVIFGLVVILPFVIFIVVRFLIL